jgi:hypothetical protein
MEVEPERELDLAPSPPPVEQTLAERRARRAAILARHVSSAANSNPGSTGPLDGVSSLREAIILFKNHTGVSTSVSTPAEVHANGMFLFFLRLRFCPFHPMPRNADMIIRLHGAFNPERPRYVLFSSP